VLELGREGKFSAKATGWDENKVIKPGEKIEISLADGHWRIVKVPAPAVEADPNQDAFIQHYPTRPKLIASLVKSRSSRLSGNGESGGIFRASAQHCASTASQVLGTPPRNEHGASLARSG
jgi:sulfur relay (sulfurtransferase) DsrC/TusE family protein